ncbi:carbohydrate ABC transporter permease [Streptomyces sp. KR80]|uniref:carbohydrate ABC transporter permease n=1 Tax=Streptomyces sp. KR80 TaxID=3457426 RepID=UPI003FD05913
MRRTASWTTYGALLAVGLGSAFPLCWSFLLATQDNEDIGRTPPTLVPGGQLWSNVHRVFGQVEFAKAIVNSLVVSGSVTVSVVVSSTLAGFAFAKLRFRGRRTLMLVVVATMLIPTQLGIVPLYILMSELGWTGRLQAVIVPMMVTAFGVFFMRQYLSRAVSDELLEAARIDGCSTTATVRHVVVPAARPAAAVLGLFTFVQAWNDFLWPLVVLTPEDPTVPVALSSLASGYVEDYSLVLAGTALGTLPTLVVFALLGRQIVGEFMRGVLK